ncbi:MAG TPA: helix-turn-helix transcriptional regulator [Chitinophagaceae bacterium]
MGLTMMSGTKLRVLRIGQNWSQDQIADKIGISQAAYAKLESGKTRLTMDRAQQLADIYEIEPKSFFSKDIIVHSDTRESNNMNSRNIVVGPDTIIPTETFDKIVGIKSEILEMLQSEIAESRKERELFFRLLEKLTAKF